MNCDNTYRVQLFVSKCSNKSTGPYQVTFPVGIWKVDEGVTNYVQVDCRVQK